MLQTHLGSADLHATFFPCARGEGPSASKGEGPSGSSPKKHILQVHSGHTWKIQLALLKLNAVCVLYACVYVGGCGWAWHMSTAASFSVPHPVLCSGVHAPDVCAHAVQPKSQYNIC